MLLTQVKKFDKGWCHWTCCDTVLVVLALVGVVTALVCGFTVLPRYLPDPDLHKPKGVEPEYEAATCRIQEVEMNGQIPCDLNDKGEWCEGRGKGRDRTSPCMQVSVLHRRRGHHHDRHHDHDRDHHRGHDHDRDHHRGHDHDRDHHRGHDHDRDHHRGGRHHRRGGHRGDDWDEEYEGEWDSSEEYEYDEDSSSDDDDSHDSRWKHDDSSSDDDDSRWKHHDSSSEEDWSDEEEWEEKAGFLHEDWMQAENFPRCFAERCGVWQGDIDEERQHWEELMEAGEEVDCYYNKNDPEEVVLEPPCLGYMMKSPGFHLVVWPAFFAIICFLAITIRRCCFISKHMFHEEHKVDISKAKSAYVVEASVEAGEMKKAPLPEGMVSHGGPPADMPEDSVYSIVGPPPYPSAPAKGAEMGGGESLPPYGGMSDKEMEAFGIMPPVEETATPVNDVVTAPPAYDDISLQAQSAPEEGKTDAEPTNA